MPMTWPELSTSEPPESPALTSALTWMSPCRCSLVPSSSSVGAMGLAERGNGTAGAGRGAALAARVAHGHDGLADLAGRRVTEAGGLEAGGVLELEHGHVVDRVVADHAGAWSGRAVAEVGHADAGGAVDDVVIGQHLAVGGQHDAGPGPGRALVVERGVDVDQGRGDLRRYALDVGRPARALAGAGGRPELPFPELPLPEEPPGPNGKV